MSSQAKQNPNRANIRHQAPPTAGITRHSETRQNFIFGRTSKPYHREEQFPEISFLMESPREPLLKPPRSKEVRGRIRRLRPESESVCGKMNVAKQWRIAPLVWRWPSVIGGWRAYFSDGLSARMVKPMVLGVEPLRPNSPTAKNLALSFLSLSDEQGCRPRPPYLCKTTIDAALCGLRGRLISERKPKGRSYLQGG